MKLFKDPEYLDRFRALGEAGKGYLEGNTLLIELLDEAEERKSKGGIILQTSDHHRSQHDLHLCVMAVILYVGRGEYDVESGKVLELDRRPGNVVEVSRAALSYRTTHPLIAEGLPEKKLALINDNAILSSWESLDDFQADFEIVNKHVTG